MLAVDVVWTEPVSARLGRKICVFPCVYWASKKLVSHTERPKTSYKKKCVRARVTRAYARWRKKGIVAGSVQAPRRCAPVVRGPDAKTLRDVQGNWLPSGRLKTQDAAAMMHVRKRVVFGRFGAI